MSLQTVVPDVDVCHHDFFEMTSPENEWDPQSKIPEVCCAIQLVYSLGAKHYIYSISSRVICYPHRVMCA